MDAIRELSKGLKIDAEFCPADVADPFDTVQWELRSAQIKDENGKLMFEQKDAEIPASWSQLATNVVVSKYFYGENGTPGNLPRIPDVNIDALGKVFGHLNLMIWLSVVLLIAAHITLFKTPIGLRIRACGEHPRAADTVGINVYAVRYGAVVFSGMLAALGGAYLSIGFGGGTFTDNMTAGRGFIALAALIFGAWLPFGAFAAALLFGLSTALAFRLPAYSGSAATLFQTLPYVLTLIAVAGVIGRTVPPAADGKPYRKQ